MITPEGIAAVAITILAGLACAVLMAATAAMHEARRARRRRALEEDSAERR